MAMSFSQTSEHEWKLDVCGYTCPHPQMYTKKALQKLASGDVLTLVFDNPSSGESIAAMCESEGNELFVRKEEGGSFVWKIRKY
ncbi:sulfurtransferase TusA family protein [Thermithiobacillus plumbiphilus]|uniref:Sulfurtransferase TusA family protein n=1 Tax=Thermithiobacillus plumbiphilus TaxID=1729899 RepID=A0ABU9D7K5_9PROT